MAYNAKIYITQVIIKPRRQCHYSPKATLLHVNASKATDTIFILFYFFYIAYVAKKRGIIPCVTSALHAHIVYCSGVFTEVDQGRLYKIFKDKDNPDISFL